MTDPFPLMKSIIFTKIRDSILWQARCNMQSTMDIARPDIKQKKKRKLAVWTVLGIVGLSAVAFAVSRLKPAARMGIRGSSI